MRQLLAIGLLLVSFGASAAPQIVIDDDPGGLVGDFQRWYGRVRESGVKVILRGDCYSACTLILTLPKEQVCVEDSATLGFHLAGHYGTDGAVIPDEELTKRLIKKFYPKPVQEWLKDKHLTREITEMDAETIVKLGVFNSCDAAPEPEKRD